MSGTKVSSGGSLKGGIQGRRSGGFTLIELMVVVAVIGILTSIAASAFRDYSIRVKLTEAGRLFSPVKTGFTMYYSQTGSLPTALADLSSVSDQETDFAGDYVEWLRVENNGNVRVRTRNVAELGGAADRLLEFRPTVSNNSAVLNWDIFTDSDTSTWVPEKYLPTI